jgi:hypothetical protein
LVFFPPLSLSLCFDEVVAGDYWCRFATFSRGLDVKTFLHDWANWTNAQIQAAMSQARSHVLVVYVTHTHTHTQTDAHLLHYLESRYVAIACV